MIINKRFFRKLHNKIYLLLCIVILSSLFIFSGYIKNIQNKLDSYYQDHSIILMITNEDVEEQISEYKGINSIISDKLVFEPNEKKNTTFSHQGFVLKKDNQIIEEQEGDNTKLFWEDFETLKHLLVSYDKNLKGNEVALYSSFYLEEEKIKDTLGKTMNVIYQNKEYDFKIKSVDKSTFSEVKISKEMYDSLYKNKNTYTYVLSFNNIETLNTFYDFAKEKFNPLFRDAHIEVNSDYNNFEQILYLYKDWKYLIYIIIIAILFVIILNITSDEKNDIGLDYTLGYSKRAIKNNLFKVYMIFGFIVSLLSLIISYVFSLIFNDGIKLGLNIYDVFTYIIILFLILVINVIIVKIKLDD